MLYCTSWSSGLERFSLVLKPLRFLVLRISVSDYVNLFLVVERTNRVSFSDIHCHACNQLCCHSGVVFK